MPEQAKARYLTYSWLRQGLLAGLEKGPAPDLKTDHLSVPLSVSVNGQSANLSLELYGPGDVTGIDRSEIIRVEPAPGSGGFEPNLFPLIEFDRPDFPWLFTPETADSGSNLPPWICLVVVPQALARLSVGADRLLPRLHCPRGELPDLREAWAWAHTQIMPTGTTSAEPASGELSAIVGSQPERTLARLICPRRLQPQTGYLACLVPLYECGRRTGLGLPPVDHTQNPLDPAWQFDPAAQDEIELPVYFHWHFSTAEKGDFELLASQLTPKDAPSSLGTQLMDISHPGWGLRVSEFQTVLDFHGPLLADDGDGEGRGPDRATQDALRQLLNQNADAQDGEIQKLTPPLYGQNYAGLTSVAVPGDQPNWFAELNLDPRYRAAAGLGADVIRREQDKLMAEAWVQLAAHYHGSSTLSEAGPIAVAGDSEPVPADAVGQPGPARPLERLRRAQLALEVGERLKSRHLEMVNTARLLQLTGLAPSDQSIAPRADFSRALGDSHSAAYRRLTRGGGPLAGRLRRAGTIPSAQMFREAVLASAPDQGTAFQMRAQFQSMEVQGAAMSARIEPRSLVNLALERENLPPEGLDTTTFAPRFERPMYETLRSSHRELFLPGYQAVANESVSLLKANQRFIEAYMTGLNHEMARELLWRDYPSPADATYFARFWDRSGSLAPMADDVRPLSDWALDSRLGDHGTGANAEPLVLLVRGELMKRYPRALVYAVKAVLDPVKNIRQPAGQELWPSFRANLDADQLLFGFDLRAEQVSGGTAGPDELGWYFVIQEQPTEPRFGLDEAGQGAPKPFSAAQGSWRNLSWSHIDAEPSSVKAGPYLWLETTFKDLILQRAQWGRSSAEMAFITRQKPFRVAIHGSLWVPPIA